MGAKGRKVLLSLPGWSDLQPGIVLEEPRDGFVEVPSNHPDRAGQMVRFPTSRALVVSLRTPLGGGDPYLFLSDENIVPRFAFPRTKMVAGLDADPETGAIYDLDELTDLAVASMQAHNLETRAARTAQPALPADALTEAGL